MLDDEIAARETTPWFWFVAVFPIGGVCWVEDEGADGVIVRVRAGFEFVPAHFEWLVESLCV